MPLQQICEPLQLFGAGRLSGWLFSAVVPHTPAALQVATKHFGGVGQSTHCAPPTPHVSIVLVWHVPATPGPLEQHPLGQLAALQTQSPLTQLFPAGQAVHCSPPVPHVVLLLDWQTPATPGPFEQHPLGQLAALHTQSPFTHAFPAGHAVHCSPPTPQVVFELVWHVPATPGPLEQQPAGQLAALQTQSPLTQALPAGQAVHCSPPVPQELFVLGWHVPGLPGPAEQHPAGQLAALQTQFPATHAFPAGHAVHCSPPVPQFAVVLGRQTPTLPGPFEQHPAGQLSSLQTQFPPTQVVPVGQTSQVSPPVPQIWSVFPVRQTPWASQQPVGQLAALQPQSPSTQV